MAKDDICNRDFKIGMRAKPKNINAAAEAEARLADTAIRQHHYALRPVEPQVRGFHDFHCLNNGGFGLVSEQRHHLSQIQLVNVEGEVKEVGYFFDDLQNDGKLVIACA